MEYIHTFLYTIIQSIKFTKLYIFLYIFFMIIANMLLVIYFRKNNYDKNLLKIYKLLKNKNFFSNKLIKNLKKKVKINKMGIINFYDDKNIKLFNFIKREIKKKYNLNNVETQNIIFYLYHQIKDLDNI